MLDPRNGMALSAALGLRAGAMVALTGGGGKTSALYRIGRELAAAGQPVILTGTTRFTPPDGAEPPNLHLVDDEEQLRSVAAAPGAWPRTVAAGWGSKGRLMPLDAAWLDRLRRELPELSIVIEADGSAMRPFKAPGSGEPVVPATATDVVSVVGLDVIGRPLDERAVHRPERVMALTGLDTGATVTPDVVAAVLCHPDGGRRGTPTDARWHVLLNKADTDERQQAALAIAERLRSFAARVVVARLRSDTPVLGVYGDEAASG